VSSGGIHILMLRLDSFSAAHEGPTTNERPVSLLSERNSYFSEGVFACQVLRTTNAFCDCALLVRNWGAGKLGGIAGANRKGRCQMPTSVSRSGAEHFARNSAAAKTNCPDNAGQARLRFLMMLFQ